MLVFVVGSAKIRKNKFLNSFLKKMSKFSLNLVEFIYNLEKTVFYLGGYPVW